MMQRSAPTHQGPPSDLDRGLDLRLVPFAAAAWTATAIALLWGPGVAALLAVSAALGALVVLAVSLNRGRTEHLFLIGAVALFLSCFAGGAAARVDAAESSAVAQLAREGSVATLTLEITDDPKAVSSNPRQRMILARATTVETPQGSVQTGGEITVFASGDNWAALIPGHEVVARGRLSEPTRAGMTVAIFRPSGDIVSVSGPPRYQQWAADIRQRLASAAQSALPPAAAGLLPGLVVGDVSNQLPETKTDFFASGLAHLTAVSGANVSIVLGAVLLVVRGVGIGPRTGAVLAGIALVAFVIVARPSPSVVRAAAMGAVTLLALVAGRSKQAMPALAVSVIALLAVWPGLAVDFGFALSVAATAALIAVAPVWVAWLRERGWPRGVAEVFSVSLAACVVTAPIVAAMTGTVSIVSVAANIAVAPVVAFITVVGVVAALVGVLSVGGASLLLACTGPPLWWILEVARRAAGLPGATLTVPSGIQGVGVVLVLAAILAFGWWRRGSPAGVCIASLALVTCVRML
ncbi:MAG: ComEC/Rec2 family competence protein [Rhodococcus sp.]|nr:ComEC/Rec2 family competence protein [Rhodococcus sp. (in: high G+C Gram-positive bacteria)]